MTSNGTSPMYVIKRDGSRASVSFDKITSRITKLCYGLDPKVSECVFVYVCVRVYFLCLRKCTLYRAICSCYEIVLIVISASLSLSYT